LLLSRVPLPAAMMAMAKSGVVIQGYGLTGVGRVGIARRVEDAVIRADRAFARWPTHAMRPHEWGTRHLFLGP